jgi:hypothetical protein
VKSPWEAALEDGTVNTAFQELWPNRLPGAANPSGTLERNKEPLGPVVPTTLSAAAPVQPKLNMKPLDSVPKMLPNFKAQPQQTLTAAESEAAAPAEEKPFVPTPLRPDNVNPYKPKAAKGWGNTPGTSSIYTPYAYLTFCPPRNRNGLDCASSCSLYYRRLTQNVCLNIFSLSLSLSLFIRQK